MILAPEIAALLDDPVMMIMSTETDNLWPTIGRCLGARAVDSQTFEVIFSQGRYPEIGRRLAAGCRMAVTITRLRDHVSYQIKGRAVSEAISAADAALAASYREQILAFFLAAGVHEKVIQQWIGGTSLLRARLDVSEVYNETPGPRAGPATGLGA